MTVILLIKDKIQQKKRESDKKDYESSNSRLT